MVSGERLRACNRCKLSVRDAIEIDRQCAAGKDENMEKVRT